MNLFINCKLLSFGNSVMAPAPRAGATISMSLCEKPLDCDRPIRVPRFRTRSKTIASPKTNPSCVHYSIRDDLFQIWEHVGSDVRLDEIFTSERSERATITICKVYIYLILPCIHFVLLPNFVSHFGHHITL